MKNCKSNDIDKDTKQEEVKISENLGTSPKISKVVHTARLLTKLAPRKRLWTMDDFNQNKQWLKLCQANLC